MAKVLFKIKICGGILLLFSACGGVDERVYTDAWYDVYGRQCGSLRPSCNFFADGKKIHLTQDPNWGKGIPSEATNGSIGYVDSWGQPQNYEGYYWLSPNGIIYGNNNTGNYDAINDSHGEGRNVVGDVARQETEFLNRSAKDFSRRYGLSPQTGTRVAQALVSWPLLTHGRARTEKEIERITFSLYGISADRIKLSLSRAEEGDLALLEKNIEEAALNWSTTPEVFKTIQKNWFSWAINSYR